MRKLAVLLALIASLSVAAPAAAYEDIVFIEGTTTYIRIFGKSYSDGVKTVYAFDAGAQIYGPDDSVRLYYCLTITRSRDDVPLSQQSGCFFETPPQTKITTTRDFDVTISGLRIPSVDSTGQPTGRVWRVSAYLENITTVTRTYSACEGTAKYSRRTVRPTTIPTDGNPPHSELYLFGTLHVNDRVVDANSNKAVKVTYQRCA